MGCNAYPPFMKKTTVSVSEETRKRLEKNKVHPRELIDDVIRRLLDDRENVSRKA